MAHADLIVTDDFYDDPCSVREFALNMPFRTPEFSTWRGLHSSDRHPETRDAFFRICHVLRPGSRHNWNDIEKSYEFWGYPSAGLFALLLSGQTDDIHFHRRTRWAAVCYLTPDDRVPVDACLVFYRHNGSGISNISNAPVHLIDAFRQEGADKTLWSEVKRVPMRYNRLVAFDARFFHAASDGFGANRYDGRLTQLFNINFN